MGFVIFSTLLAIQCSGSGGGDKPTPTPTPSDGGDGGPSATCPSGQNKNASGTCVCPTSQVLQNNVCLPCSNGQVANADATACITPASSPGTPKLLTATSKVAEIVLTWSQGDGTSPESYTLLWRTSPDSNVTEISKTIANIRTVTYTHTGLTPGAVYYYKIFAVNIIGASALTTNWISASPLLKVIDSDSNGLIEIYNVDMLYNIRYNLAGTSYKISADNSAGETNGCPLTGCRGYELASTLDFATTKWASGGAVAGGWEPIGTELKPFTAILDGKGYIINNLYSENANSNKGLFAYIKNATISNVALENVKMLNGGSSIGALAGNAILSIISNSYVKGLLSGNGTIGGLVGASIGSILKNSYALITINNKSSENAGGLVGTMSYPTDASGNKIGDGSRIENSYASGTINGINSNGGLVGRLESFWITSSYANVNIIATSNNNGGLVGFIFGNDCKIEGSYARGSVSGTTNAGGIIGNILGSSNMNINYSYASVDITSTANVGGLVGGGSLTITSTYWNSNSIQTVGTARDLSSKLSIGSESTTIYTSSTRGIALSTTQLQNNIDNVSNNILSPSNFLITPNQFPKLCRTPLTNGVTCTLSDLLGGQ